MTVRREPCSACPYRRDVPSGVWSAEEYEKLPAYDRETWDQPLGAFMCHATPDHFCHGWVVVHGWELLALRLADRGHAIEIPSAVVPLFDSGAEAAKHGLRDIDRPTDAATDAMRRLLRKHPRLRG